MDFIPLLLLILLIGSLGYLGMAFPLASSAKNIIDALRFVTIVSLSSFLLFPAIALIATTLFVTIRLDAEFFALIWISALPTQKIVQGIRAGIAYQLRFLQIMSLGMLAPLVSSLPFWMGPVGLGWECVGSHCESHIHTYTTKCGFLSPVIAISFLGIAEVYLFRLATLIGIWISLQWEKLGRIISGGVALASLILISPIVGIIVLILWERLPNPDWTEFWYLPLLCLLVFFLLDRGIALHVRHIVETATA